MTEPTLVISDLACMHLFTDIIAQEQHTSDGLNAIIRHNQTKLQLLAKSYAFINQVEDGWTHFQACSQRDFEEFQEVLKDSTRVLGIRVANIDEVLRSSQSWDVHDVLLQTTQYESSWEDALPFIEQAEEALEIHMARVAKYSDFQSSYSNIAGMFQQQCQSTSGPNNNSTMTQHFPRRDDSVKGTGACADGASLGSQSEHEQLVHERNVNLGSQSEHEQPMHERNVSERARDQSACSLDHACANVGQREKGNDIDTSLDSASDIPQSQAVCSSEDFFESHGRCAGVAFPHVTTPTSATSTNSSNAHSCTSSSSSTSSTKATPTNNSAPKEPSRDDAFTPGPSSVPSNVLPSSSDGSGSVPAFKPFRPKNKVKTKCLFPSNPTCISTSIGEAIVPIENILTMDSTSNTWFVLRRQNGHKFDPMKRMQSTTTYNYVAGRKLEKGVKLEHQLTNKSTLQAEVIAMASLTNAEMLARHIAYSNATSRNQQKNISRTSKVWKGSARNNARFPSIAKKLKPGFNIRVQVCLGDLHCPSCASCTIDAFVIQHDQPSCASCTHCGNGVDQADLQRAICPGAMIYCEHPECDEVYMYIIPHTCGTPEARRSTKKTAKRIHTQHNGVQLIKAFLQNVPWENARTLAYIDKIDQLNTGCSELHRNILQEQMIAIEMAPTPINYAIGSKKDFDDITQYQAESACGGSNYVQHISYYPLKSDHDVEKPETGAKQYAMVIV